MCKYCPDKFCLLRKFEDLHSPHSPASSSCAPPPSKRDSVYFELVIIVCWDHCVVYLPPKTHHASKINEPIPPSRARSSLKFRFLFMMHRWYDSCSWCTDGMICFQSDPNSGRLSPQFRALILSSRCHSMHGPFSCAAIVVSI